ncbi:LRR receptor-like serine/threonine-protein kinase GSO1 [Asparagus officinalis]|uniref:LRR receptor-like serine/threonine-protein kinase GSO1 n=1 Tax=Asparagus officinalis TaxID=4686 RepID=UPI00098E5FCE|nr:LRR receptor-like serine/threonine-protein kinase GSO1 [Asparagus officinalis]
MPSSFLHLLFLLSLTILCSEASSNHCKEAEKQALLDFKAGGNDFHTNEVPEFIGSLQKLEYLDLSDARFAGKGPHQLGNLSSLWIPAWLFNVSSLSILQLDGNNFHGTIPEEIGNNTNLEILDLSGNMDLDVGNSKGFGKMCNLKTLFLSSIDIYKEFVDIGDIFSQCNEKSLEILRIEESGLAGNLPDWLWEFKNLKQLELGGNQLEGVIYQKGFLTEAHFSGLGRLKDLDISYNSLALEVSPSCIPPFQLNALLMSSSTLGPQFPSWLRTQKNLSYLWLSATVPEWIWNFSSHLYFIDLSDNKLRGKIPSWINFEEIEYTYIDLSSNCLEGSIPYFPSNTIHLDLSNNSFSGYIPPKIGEAMPNLEYLSLSMNNISGSIPPSLCKIAKLKILDLSKNRLSGQLPNVWSRDSELLILDVKNNHLTGGIPDSLCTSVNLRSLHLVDNKFSGELPLSLRKCQRIVTLDLGENKFAGNIPRWENVLVVFKGREIMYDMLLSLVSMIDLSDNYLSGNIPGQLASLYGLKSLNLSVNHLSGEISANIGRLGQLESLDLSKNKISGPIPPSLSNLNFLSHLNLSFNNLTGEITTGNQLQTFTEASIYIGNAALCGIPLSTKCEDEEDSQVQDDKYDEERYETVMYWNSVGCGFFFGLSLIFGLLALKRTWRNAYFEFVDHMYDTSPISQRKKL